MGILQRVNSNFKCSLKFLGKKKRKGRKEGGGKEKKEKGKGKTRKGKKKKGRKVWACKKKAIFSTTNIRFSPWQKILLKGIYNIDFRCFAFIHSNFKGMHLYFISIHNFDIFSVWKEISGMKTQLINLGVWTEIVWHETRPKILTPFLLLITFPQQFYVSDIWEHLTIHIRRNSSASQKRCGLWHDHHCLPMWEFGKI